MPRKRNDRNRRLRSVSLQFERRIKIVRGILMLAFSVLVCALFVIQLIRGSALKKMASEQQLKDVTLSAARGTIYDRNKKPLAVSVSVWTVVVDPRNLRDENNNIIEEKREEVAARLAAILNMDYEKVYNICGKNSQYEIIKDDIDAETKDKVIALRDELSDRTRKNRITGVIELTPGYKRTYPYNEFASAVIGYVGSDNEGQGGVERQYDSYLTGVPGRMVAAKDAQGRNMPDENYQMIDAQDGSNLVLTIDEVIQHYVEKNVEVAIQKNKVANRACAIMMDVNSGEILAMSVQEGFDPNQSRRIHNDEIRKEIDAMPENTDKEKEEKSERRINAQFEQWRNKAVSDTYEPGSVFKIITSAMGLEEGLVSPDSGSFTCTGVFRVKGRNIRCHNPSGHGTQNFSQIVQNSCNPGFMQLGQMIGVDRFTKYFAAFGLTEKTGIDLPEEMKNTGLYHTKEKMGIVELSSSSFGQSFGVTPIQMVTAVAAATNGGYLVQPHVLKQVEDKDGKILKSVDRMVKRQVISEETSAKLCAILETVVSKGTGKNARVDGYKVAGKTGTSEKLSSEDKSARIASFCGIAPAENPQVVLLLMFDEPNGSSKYGSVVAAPVFSSIMEEVLPYLGVQKSYTKEELKNLEIETPDISDMTVEEAKRIAAEQSLDIHIIGSGEKVVRQMPEAGHKIPKRGKIVAYAGEIDQSSMVEVPDFNKMTLSHANSTANEYELNISISSNALDGGNLECVGQSITPGTMVAKGTVIRLDFVTLDMVE